MDRYRQRPHWGAILGVVGIAILLGFGPASIFTPFRTDGLAVGFMVVVIVMIARHTQRV